MFSEFGGWQTVQVGRTGMETGADAEILSLLDLPSSAPDLWKLMSNPDIAAKQSAKTSHASQEVIAADARVPILSG